MGPRGYGRAWGPPRAKFGGKSAAGRKAEIHANPGGARIGRLTVLKEEAARQPAVVFFPRLHCLTPTPIEAGEDKLTVTVTARFELTQ
jgi:uncharacterized protein YggE